MSTIRLLSVLPLGALLVAGCQVTPEKIAQWKETERGPGKISDALKSSSVPAETRGLALSALVELGMLSDAEDDLKDVPAAERQQVIHAAVPGLVKMAGDGGGAQTTRAQRNAKDAMYKLRADAAPADRDAIDDALVAWTTADLAGRMSAGGYSSDMILKAVGPRAGPRLAQVIADPLSSDASRLEGCKLLGDSGDNASREQAAAKLIERARRERQVQESTLEQIGLVGGDHAVAYLSQLAEDGHQTATVRQKALLALAQKGDPAALPVALRIAADGHAPGEARDAAFDVAEKVGPQAVPGLVKLLDDKDANVRWQAVEAALKAGQAAAVKPILEGLPQGKSYSKEDLRSYVVHDVALIGAPALAPLREELASKSWVARIAAVMAIGELGKADDAARLQAVAGDGTKLKGWPGGATIGSEAKAIAAALGARK